LNGGKGTLFVYSTRKKWVRRKEKRREEMSLFKTMHKGVPFATLKIELKKLRMARE